jgi:hypothetical protein
LPGTGAQALLQGRFVATRWKSSKPPTSATRQDRFAWNARIRDDIDQRIRGLLSELLD